MNPDSCKPLRSNQFAADYDEREQRVKQMPWPTCQARQSNPTILPPSLLLPTCPPWQSPHRSDVRRFAHRQPLGQAQLAHHPHGAAAGASWVAVRQRRRLRVVMRWPGCAACGAAAAAAAQQVRFRTVASHCHGIRGVAHMLGPLLVPSMQELPVLGQPWRLHCPLRCRI